MSDRFLISLHYYFTLLHTRAKNTSFHISPIKSIEHTHFASVRIQSSALPTVSVPRASACLHFPESLHVHDQIHYFSRKLHV